MHFTRNRKAESHALTQHYHSYRLNSGSRARAKHMCLLCARSTICVCVCVCLIARVLNRSPSGQAVVHANALTNTHCLRLMTMCRRQATEQNRALVPRTADKLLLSSDVVKLEPKYTRPLHKHTHTYYRVSALFSSHIYCFV